ncbi:hypothetical protein [Aestuariibaculum marinum]|uniref:Uncharacterized protein n=1 Tax=Aestuariibaculum marinum TaxID=2683592 RepID=A0A8J6Q035_9FLAO|nr:hypothetical protein [Aestuariibaculum marinum]MBD0822639.1 hypothetical protein [Aestuariibaculum marinum]
MAGVNGLTPLFKGKQLQNIFDQFKKQVDEKTLQTLQYLGEQFVNQARLTGNYTDRTGNLRSSIGYIILLDGKVIFKNFSGKQNGKSKAQEFANEVALKYPEGYVLVGVAGMDYAAAVEAKGYDVITGSAPDKDDLGSILRSVF